MIRYLVGRNKILIFYIINELIVKESWDGIWNGIVWSVIVKCVYMESY